MKSLSNSVFRSITFIALLASIAAAQKPKAAPPEPSFLESYGLYLGILAVVGLIVFAVKLRQKKGSEGVSVAPKNDGGIRITFRKNAEKTVNKKEEQEEEPEEEVPVAKAPSAVLLASKKGLESKPISSITRLQRTNPFPQLPDSRDHDLLRAIEQTNEESDEDVQVRTQALKLLSSFKTANAVSAIAQIALYDLSAKLRSDAVSALAEIDHESVFEAIVTACADPTREVRAAAARGLFKLTFDRAHAWARIVESEDTSRMRHVARCASEGDLVARSFDRLTHPDQKIAYEAFALTVLLVRSGEADPIFKALGEHRDENVKLALLHVLQSVQEETSFDRLSHVLTHYNLSPNIAAKVNEVRSCLQMSHA